MTHFLKTFVLLSAVFASAFSYAGHHKEGEMKPATIVDLAVAAEATSTLVTAVKAADLVGVLSGDGPFTVLAPTNAAFAKLPEGTLSALLADPAALAEVLKAHVISGKAMAADVVKATEVVTLNGTYSVQVAGEGVAIGGANVIATDLVAKNGVVHLIDTVIIPE
ncbi:MAG: fasciclin domain-containing protein [Proteobacteria bacterium]|nr:fasciclin domain-containing protein [Pseudomonadota bacterium]